MARRRVAIIFLAALLLSESTAMALLVAPQRDWSFTIGQLRFGYVEMPSSIPSAGYSNAKPYELHFGFGHMEFGTRGSLASFVVVVLLAVAGVPVVAYRALQGNKVASERRDLTNS